MLKVVRVPLLFINRLIKDAGRSESFKIFLIFITMEKTLLQNKKINK